MFLNHLVAECTCPAELNIAKRFLIIRPIRTCDRDHGVLFRHRCTCSNRTECELERIRRCPITALQILFDPDLIRTGCFISVYKDRAVAVLAIICHFESAVMILISNMDSYCLDLAGIDNAILLIQRITLLIRTCRFRSSRNPFLDLILEIILVYIIFDNQILLQRIVNRSECACLALLNCNSANTCSGCRCLSLIDLIKIEGKRCGAQGRISLLDYIEGCVAFGIIAVIYIRPVHIVLARLFDRYTIDRNRNIHAGLCRIQCNSYCNFMLRTIVSKTILFILIVANRLCSRRNILCYVVNEGLAC